MQNGGMKSNGRGSYKRTKANGKDERERERKKRRYNAR